MATRHLITSALPYVNGVKHLGNLVGSMLPADVFARFQRARGADVMFICGSDDHGTPIEIAAQKEGQPTAAFVNKWHDFQENIYRQFGLSFDHFGSSSRPQNHALTQHFARQLLKAGLLEVRTEKMLYSEADKRFLPDRYVEGTCPHCAYTKARGDQCENCGRVLDPTDLLNPRSAISGSTALEVRETSHLYFKQSQLVPKLKAWIDQQTHWPAMSRGIAYKWLEEGLQDRGITRDIQWGVPVPADIADALGAPDLANKVFYVWFDAPIAYIAATQEYDDLHAKNNQAKTDYRNWWLGQKDVTYTEFMGKDNVYFHTMSFPATLLGSGEPWQLVSTLKSFSWLTYYGGKFSTSQQIGIFTDAALELSPADDDIISAPVNWPDYWRYYLMARAPETDDSSFTWDDFQQTCNKDLANVFGNFINRTLQLTNKNFGTTIPNQSGWTVAEEALLNRLQDLLVIYTEALETMEFRKAQEALRTLWVAGNEYLAAQEPWQVVKTDKDRAATILSVAIHLIPLYATLAKPFTPFSSDIISALLPDTTNEIWPTDLRSALTCYTGSTFNLPTSILFPQIADSKIAQWKVQFNAPL